jgi:membrane-bound ClpP family serine protease
MLYKFIIFTCFAFPLIGIIMMEYGSYGLSINELSSRNYASEAFLAYSLVTFLTIVICHQLGIFAIWEEGAQSPYRIRTPSPSTRSSCSFRCLHSS